MNQQEQTEALALAKDLLDDIELSRLGIGQRVNKARRLARLVNDEVNLQWIQWEASGYFTLDDVNRLSFDRSNRSWTITDAKNQTEDVSMYGSAGAVEQERVAYASQLAAMAIPALSGDNLNLVVTNLVRNQSRVTNMMTQRSGVVTAVDARLYEFAASTYYSLKLTTRQDTMFERAKASIDELLVSLGDSALRQIDSAYANLRAGDAESISGAMNSVRRLIDGFADQVFPATEDTRTNGQGQVIKLGIEQRLNRLKAFIDDNALGDTRATRLKRSLGDIYARVSTGVHNEVTASEAEYLFLNTYVLLGEVLALPGRTSEVTADVEVA
jgi:AbiTii